MQKIHRRSTRFSPARVVGMTLSSLILSAAPALADSAHGRTIELETIVTIPAHDSTIRLWIPTPLDSPVQEVLSLESSSPTDHAIHQDELHGNRYLYTELAPSDTSRTVSWRATVRRSPWLGPVPEPVSDTLLAEYTRPLTLVPVGGPLLSPRVDSLSVGQANAHEKGRAIFDYVLDQMKYDKSVPGWGTGSVEFACDARTGNCSDFHALFNGLARTAELPARFTMGMSVPSEAEGTIGGYHCWTAYWIDDEGWMPADISEADKHPETPVEQYYGHLDANRIALARGRDLILSPAQDGAPLNFAFGPYLEADGKPLEELASTTRTYREVAPTATGE